MEKKKYPIGPEYYTLHEEVGQGASASVLRAVCIPFNEIVAIKILDFERVNCDLNNISREAQTMVLVDHPNVLKSHCSFVNDHSLWVVMPYMSGGSCLHILKAAYPDGFEEVVIATILREVLKGLEYLHHHGHIHRDVKAGNILIDSRGGIKLGDFGVSACMFDSGDRKRMRNTFVGTPCWMAPEVLEQLHGYDFKADIWSFGITALELAHGHAPFSKYPPMKVLLMTLQNAPPGLDYERDRKFSKSFKQMIASCLVKDPSKRPSAKKLLKHSFFKQARSNDFIVRTLLEGLPALGDRIQALKRKEEDMLAQKKIPDGEMEELSQNEYKRGISGWNFNLEDMKAQASLIPDEDLLSYTNLEGHSCSLTTLDGIDKRLEFQTYPQAIEKEDNDLVQNQPAHLAAIEPTKTSVKDRSERSKGKSSVGSPSHGQHVISPIHDDHVESNLGEKPIFEINEKSSDIKPFHQMAAPLTGSTIPESIIPATKGESDRQNQLLNMSGGNGDGNGGANGIAVSGGEDAVSELSSKSSALSSDDLDEKPKPPVVQQRGRFKVTSESIDVEKVAPTPVLQKSQSMQVGTSEMLTPHPIVSQAPTSDAASSVSGVNLFPVLQTVLQTINLQREDIHNLMRQIYALEPTANHSFEGVGMPTSEGATDKSLLEAAHDRERELLYEITELQRRLIGALEELQKYKTENA